MWGYWDNDVNDGKGGHCGYFWMSYYDQSICEPESYEFSLAADDDNDVTAQYDYLPSSSTIVADESEAPTYSANIFTADADMEITTLSTMTTAIDTTVTYQIYRLSEDAASPPTARWHTPAPRRTTTAATTAMRLTLAPAWPCAPAIAIRW